MYAAQIGVDAKGDDLYPILAFKNVALIGVVFIIGLISALYFLLQMVQLQHLLLLFVLIF